MKIYSMEECEKYIEYRKEEVNGKELDSFRLLDEEGDSLAYDYIIQLNSKCFNYDINRIEKDINKLTLNYPQLNKIVDTLKIYLFPKPTYCSFNASAYGSRNFIILYARGTQIPNSMCDYILSHEIGHIVQGQLASDWVDDTKDKWLEYCSLRNITPGNEGYDAEWDERPREVFAEDFRWFFGCETGEEYWGLPIDKPTEEIKKFMLSL